MTARSIARPFRPSLDALKPFDHGPTAAEIRAASRRDDIVNLATNENAYGPSPEVLSAVRQAAGEGWIYPDPRCEALRTEIAGGLDVSPERLIFGAGAETLLEFITRATLAPGDGVLISPPTFPIYANNARVLGAHIVAVPRRPDFTIDRDAMVAAIDDRVRVVFLCNPDNPTGTPVPAEDVAAIAAAAGPERLTVVDEAYQEFADYERPRTTIAALDRSGACYFVLRTFSKAFALGGYRVGYAIASTPDAARTLDLVRTQFSVNTLAQAAAMAAWRDPAHLATVVRATRAARDGVLAEARSLGFDIPVSAANFIFLSLPSGAQPLYRHLLSDGILTRPAGDIGLRVTIGRAEQNRRFLSALATGPRR